MPFVEDPNSLLKMFHKWAHNLPKEFHSLLREIWSDIQQSHAEDKKYLIIKAVEEVLNISSLSLSQKVLACTTFKEFETLIRGIIVDDALKCLKLKERKVK